MCRNGGIEILNPRSTAFQGCLDAAESPTDGIGPFGAWEFCGDEIEARLQRRPPFRPRQTLDAQYDLGPFLFVSLVGVGCRLIVIGPLSGTLVGTRSMLGTSNF